MSLAPSIPAPNPGLTDSLRRFSPDEYHRMIDAGILTEDDDIELLEGLLVGKMVRKPPHDVAVSLVQATLGAKLPATHFCRVQSAISTADSEPEPDVAVVTAPPRRYIDAHPTASDVVLIVEVAEASLGRDRRDKARIYARAGINCYWIVNLVDLNVEVFTLPAADGSYALRNVLARHESIELNVGDASIRVPVADLLP